MDNAPNFYQGPSDLSQSPAVFPPQAQAPIEASGFGVRAAARVIDTVIGLGLNFGVASAVTFIALSLAEQSAVQPGWQRDLRELTPTSLGVAILGPFLYHSIAESMGGATIGKAILGLRVRDDDMSPCSVGGALIRTLTYPIDALFCGLVAYISMSRSRSQQRVGDRWGSTVVVSAAGLKRTGARLPGVAGGIMIGLLLWAGMLFLHGLIKVL